MKTILFFLLIFSLTSAQNISKDTLLGNGSQPASIIKIDNHKLYIVQNKEMVTPYQLQKDGSFVSRGVPVISIDIDKTKTAKDPRDLVREMFRSVRMADNESKEIIKSDETDVFVKTTNVISKQVLQLVMQYPLKDRMLNFYFSVNYKDDDDRIGKYYAIKDIITGGIWVFEDYYLHKKE